MNVSYSKVAHVCVLSIPNRIEDFAKWGEDDQISNFGVTGEQLDEILAALRYFV